jgi:8-oxo-dGTP diphosphatase
MDQERPSGLGKRELQHYETVLRSSHERLGNVPELAAAVVMHNDHVLIVRRSQSEGFLPGRWGVPSGKIDAGESSQQAALRELYEETGLSGAVVSHVGRSDFRSTWHGQRVLNVQHNYLISPDVDPERVDSVGMPKVTLPKEDQKARWVPASRIATAGLDQHNIRTIRQGLKGCAHPQPVSSSSTNSS